MGRRDWSTTPDLEYFQNNGVIAIRPTQGGRLACLRKQTKGSKDRVWVFADATIWHDDDGDERINHHRRGVVCGTYAQGHAFIETCRELGLSVVSSGFYVPFSRGELRYGRWGDGTPVSDYDADELKRMRWDLPSKALLKEILGGSFATLINVDLTASVERLTSGRRVLEVRSVLVGHDINEGQRVFVCELFERRLGGKVELVFPDRIQVFHKEPMFLHQCADVIQALLHESAAAGDARKEIVPIDTISPRVDVLELVPRPDRPFTDADARLILSLVGPLGAQVALEDDGTIKVRHPDVEAMDKVADLIWALKPSASQDNASA
jgi:hypothetical protein